MDKTLATVIWAAVLLVVLVPVIAAATSPLLAWREPIYIGAGLAGIVALSLAFLQPLLVGSYLPGLRAPCGRRVHRITGGLLVVAVVFHIAGLWVTSPPDMVDALTFTSPTPFSFWGVIAMWAVFAAAILALLRRWMRLPLRTWRRVHTSLAGVIAGGSVVHAMLIQGTMQTWSKTVLCVLVLAATATVIADLRVWARRTP